MADDELIEAVAFTLFRVLNKVQADRRSARDYGSGQSLTMIEAEVCALIGASPGTTGSEIAQALGVTRSAVSQVVTKLTAKAQIRAERDATNGSIKHLYLTPVGRTAATGIWNYYQEMTRSVLGSSPRRDLNTNLRFVQQLEAYLDEVRPTD